MERDPTSKRGLFAWKALHAIAKSSLINAQLLAVSGVGNSLTRLIHQPQLPSGDLYQVLAK